MPACQAESKKLTLRNDGKHPTIFKIESVAELSGYLSIRPETGTMNPEEEIDLEVHLTAMSLLV